MPNSIDVPSGRSDQERSRMMTEAMAVNAATHIGVPLANYVRNGIVGRYRPSRASIFAVGEPTPHSASIAVEWDVRTLPDWNTVVEASPQTLVDRLVGRILPGYSVYHPLLRTGHRIRATLTREMDYYLATFQAGNTRLTVIMPQGLGSDLVLSDRAQAILFDPEKTAFSEHVPVT